VQWAIEEIWDDSLWDFKIREAALALSIVADDTSKALPEEVDKPNEFRIVNPTADQRTLISIEETYIKRYVPDLENLDHASVPKFWIRPLLYDGSVYTVRFWPPADGPYTITYSYFMDHPKLDSVDKTLIPKKWERLVIDRTVIYIKEHEDEVALGPYERRFERGLAKMKKQERTHKNVLLGWRHEKELASIQRALIGGDRSLDLGR